MLSGRYWPVHLKPRNEELLSSWLIRLCEAHGLRPHTFCDIVWRKKPIWNRDIDKCADFSVVHTLSLRTGTPFLRAFETHLKSYEKRLFRRLNPYGNTAWIMPLSQYHRIRRNGGLAYCWLCLEENAYYRKSWRLALNTVCSFHQCYLDTACRVCGAPINFHRVYIIKKPFWCCYKCGSDLRKRPSKNNSDLSEMDLRRQIHFDILIQDGYWYLSEGTRVLSIDVFSVTRQLIRLMLYHKSGPYIWRATGGIDLVIMRGIFSRKMVFEHLNREQRNIVLTRVYELLIDWPNRLLRVASARDFSGSMWSRDMDLVPSWYLKPLIEHGIYTPFADSDPNGSNQEK